MLTLDREAERFAFEDGWDLLIPYSMERYDGRQAQVTAIPKISRTVRSFLRKFEDAPFSDGALAWLWERVRTHEQEWGYYGGKFRWRRCKIYRAAPSAALPEPLSETRLLTPADDSCNLTTYRIAETLSAGCLAVGTVQNGRIVSVAVTHGSVRDAETGQTVELGVETAPCARGKGYAASSLAYATRVLLDGGFVPEYRCTLSNRASSKVAERVGYRRVGEACYLLMRRK